MSKLCLSTYSKVIILGMASASSNKKLIGNLMRTVDPTFDDSDDQKISGLVNGRKNIPTSTNDILDTLDYQYVLNEFTETVLPMLDKNKIIKIENGIIELIKNDCEILKETEVDIISHSTKADICSGRYKVTFLAGVFLYVLIYTKNRNTNEEAKSINDEFFSNLSNKRLAKIEKKIEDYNVSERAKQFCIKFENEIDLLPLCQIAKLLNPLHKHHREMYNEYNTLAEEIQKEINEIKGFPIITMSTNDLFKCLKKYEIEIEEKLLTTKKFLYDGAKCLRRAMIYSDKEWDDFNPYIFPRSYFSRAIKNLKSPLSSYIYDYIAGKLIDGKSMEIPMDLIWETFDLGGCSEEIMVFWCNRFVVSSCYCLYSDSCSSNIFFVEEDGFETLEDLYYAAMLSVYIVYGKKLRE